MSCWTGSCVPSAWNSTFSPACTNTVPFGVTMATVPLMTSSNASPFGITSRTYTVPRTDAVAVGVWVSTRLPESVSLTTRLKVRPRVWRALMILDRALFWTVDSSTMR